MSDKEVIYDHIIIGAGAAGLQLALALIRNPHFAEDKILILDPEAKNTNDKTWSFWQQEPGPFEELIFKRWDEGSFYSKKVFLELDLGPYSYNMIRSIDFYNHARRVIESKDNVEWLKESVSKVENQEVISDQAVYIGRYIYDSRIPESFVQDRKSVKLLQHFLGWVIEVEKPIFNPHNFTMMDFRRNKVDACSFTYILPFSATRALVEFTLFSPSLLKEEEYVHFLKDYISDILKLDDYEIDEREQGIIPMSDYDFTRENTATYTRIGTAGGWVKPSTGYSFKASGDYVNILLDSLVKKNQLPKTVHRPRSRLFDSLFLSVLEEDNAGGEQLFERMYRKLPTQTILKFLEEKTTFTEDLTVLSKFATKSFAKTLAKAQTKR